MNFGKISTTVSCSITFTMVFTFNLNLTIVCWFITYLCIQIYQRRKASMVLFNTAMLMLSLFITYTVTNYYIPISNIPTNNGQIYIWKVVIFSTVYFLVNNIQVDLLLLLKQEKYTKKAWVQKYIQVVSVLFFEMIYLIVIQLIAIVGFNGKEQLLSLLFFMPLAALSMISCSYSKVLEERMRLKSLVTISTELNKIVSASNLEGLRKQIKLFLSCTAFEILVKKNDQLTYFLGDGLINEKKELKTDFFNNIFDIQILSNLTLKNHNIFVFNYNVQSCLISPLLFDGEYLGVLLVGKSGMDNFFQEEIHSITAFSNQLSSLLKNKLLITEQKKNLILEERNRIAREIHDGMAQTLAGLVLQLEVSQRANHQKTKDENLLIGHTVEQLRTSLKDLRQSIFELRPTVDERIGLIEAIQMKVDQLVKTHTISISFKTKGETVQSSFLVEKVLYNIFQESVQNAIKHSNAKKIDIYLSYEMDNTLLKIKDNGIGFSLYDAIVKSQNEPHMGILLMQEQAERIEAMLDIESSPGNGTIILLKIQN
ncbi:sensor histidine kinase [Gottfriedia sp. NPDC057948]|uniref:sensor histidine kinase n=1 Tax=Gottfriedia sp. NPDC057948 TaxID=3346287 RepID=UPI0036D93C99